MQFREQQGNNPLRGLKLARKSGEGVFVASLGLITFDSYGETLKEIQLLTQDLMSSGQLSIEQASSRLLAEKWYSIQGTPVDIAFQPESSNIVYAFFKAPRYISIMRHELI